MNAESIRIVPNDYGYKWILAAWEVTKKHYGDCLTVAILTLIALLLFSRLGAPGTIIVAICTPLFNAGCFICTKTWLNGGKADIKDFFQVFQNSEKIKQLAPFIAFQIACSLFSSFGAILFNFGGFFYIPLIITISISLFTWFTLPLMVFTGMPFAKAISLSINAVIKNLPAIIFCIITMTLVLAVATLLLTIPLFLMVLPGMVVAGYITYATIFEGLDLQTILPKKDPPAQL